MMSGATTQCVKLRPQNSGIVNNKASIRVVSGSDVASRMPDWEAWFEQGDWNLHSLNPRWLQVLCESFNHTPHCVELSKNDECTAVLPLAGIKSLMFGRFLVSLPYLNVGGVLGGDCVEKATVIRAAASLADSLGVDHLQLRNEKRVDEPLFNQELTSKLHMRLSLPQSESELWDQLKSKVRSQIRKGFKQEIEVDWGGQEMIGDFYAIFARKMRDLGTPVFAKSLFTNIAGAFPESSEFCVCRIGSTPIAAAMLLHGKGITEVPSASSISKYNSTNVNMLMYWSLLCRAVERGQSTFDFGRTTEGSATHRFKKQWGAQPHPSVWQYYVRGDAEEKGPDDFRPESGTYARAVRLWKRLPLPVANLLGPHIVRGIP